MSAEENKAVVQRAIENWNRGDLAGYLGAVKNQLPDLCGYAFISRGRIV